jgi:Leucine-rich repeat (LRR) protein
MPQVEAISIGTAKVTFIPDFTVVSRQLPRFNDLTIVKSGLRYVERRQLAKIPQLMYLDIGDNIIESLPEDVFNDLVNLESLHVVRNKIKVLPPKLLSNMPKLKDFRASRNQIELIPRDFFKNNRDLKTIWINDNKIRRIEVSFMSLPKLNSLDLNKNSCVTDGSCNECNNNQLREIQQKIDRNCK